MQPEDAPMSLCESFWRIAPETFIAILTVIATLGASYSADKTLIAACGDGLMFVVLTVQIAAQILTLVAYSMFLTRHELSCLHGLNRRQHRTYIFVLILLILATGAATFYVSMNLINNQRVGCQEALLNNQLNLRLAPYIGVVCAAFNALVATIVVIYQIA